MSTEKVWLLEDTTIDEIPAPLASLLASTKDSFNSSSQECRLYVLALLNYYIALEIGLRTTPVPQRSVKWGFDIQDIQTQQIPQNFKQQTHFKADLYLPGDRNATRCVLLLMKSGESLFVTLTSEQWPGCSVVLSASRYVPFFNREKPASSFRNLRELSTTLKNIFWPVVNQNHRWQWSKVSRHLRNSGARYGFEMVEQSKSDKFCVILSGVS